jgi:multicomponent Na+:H+ antiporter subunit D
VSEATRLALCLALPAAGALLVAACHRWPNLREAVSLVSAAATFLVVLSLSEEVLQGGRPALRLGEMLPGLAISLELEPLGLLFALIASGLWFVSGVYCIGYMRGNKELHQTRFTSASLLPSPPRSASRSPAICSRYISSTRR